LVGAFAFTVTQSLVVPVLPALQRQLHASTSSITWVFTVYLLAASVITPIAGRLGDMFGKKLVLLIALAGLAAGSLLAAVVTTLPMLIAARAIQGLGGAVFPLTFGIIRDEFPRERVGSAIAVVSGMIGIGGGLGILFAGPILQNLSYHWLFWIPFAVTMLAMVATFLVVPESPTRAPGKIFWLGAALLSGWLVALLLGVTKAPDWGWTDPKTLGLFLLAAVMGSLWVREESRASEPLVDIAMMRLRGVWTTNAAAFFLGVAMFTVPVLIPQYVAAPVATGYGFGASVTQAGLYLLPSTIAIIISSPLGARIGRLVGLKVPLVAGFAVMALSFVALAAASASWEFYLASGVLGFGFGFSFAAVANLIVDAVRPDQTAVASGVNTIVRTIAGAIGAQVMATILTANTLSSGYPDRQAFTIAFSICAATTALGIPASIAVPGRKGAVAPATLTPLPRSIRR
jgi:EmrB/QacA subfamily drug resistance transporter